MTAQQIDVHGLPAKWRGDRKGESETDVWMLGYFQAKQEDAAELESALRQSGKDAGHGEAEFKAYLDECDRLAIQPDIAGAFNGGWMAALRQRGEAVAWRPMETAPRDGRMLRLLVQFDEHATEDSPDPSPTIGANNFDHDGEDRWRFAGWCWSHDHFTEGKGSPVGWLPMMDTAPPATSGLVEVMVDFPQVGIAGPFPVVDGKVSLPDLTMNDLIHHARAGFEPAPPATSGLVEAAKSALGLLAMYRETLEAGMGANERAALRLIGDNLSDALAPHYARGGR